MRILERIRNRSQDSEHGFGLVEIMLAVVMLSGLLLLTFGPVLNTSQAATNMVSSETGINQGEVMDKANLLYGAATELQQTWPDVPVTKENLITAGLVPTEITPDIQWGIGQSRGSNLKNTAVCVVAYSTTEQTKKYTANNPAEVTVNGSGIGKQAEGCRGVRKDGSWGFKTE